jgi:Mg2+-importing ATPase
MTSYWAQPEAKLLAALKATTAGLTQAEAARRLRRYGQNRIGTREGPSSWHLLLRQYESPLVLVLVFGALISAVVRQWIDAGIILAIVAASTTLGFVQEYRASEAVRRLRAKLALRVTVLRDGAAKVIEAHQVVPGDIVLLSAGNLIPADGVILEAKDFLVTQSALTGESFPVEKSPGCVAEDATLQQRVNCVFLGTSVRSGTARMLVTRTGSSTEFGGIAGRLSEPPPDSEFQRGIRQFGYLLTRIMTAIVIFVFTINLFYQRPLIESLLFAVALAVGLTPELLPAIVSVTLSAGARRMAARGVIVRRLEAIEDLGSLDILCTDKTGTLTRGVVELSGALDADGTPSDRAFALAALNSRLETGIDNPLDAAIVAAAEKRALPESRACKIDEIPYDFQRKRLTIVVAEPDRVDTHLLVTKGAFDNVISCCDRLARGGAEAALDDAARAGLTDFYARQGAEGFRVLAIATRRAAVKPRYDRDDETGMTFEGFLLFFDPLKDDIEKTIREFGRLGIAIKIITGDNRHVAAHVAACVGLDAGRAMTGEELAAMSPDALASLAEQTDVFAGIDPQQKERIVHALQKRGHAVAFLGDGINDAPALHAADVGISVDQAVDVARESADVVLMTRNLGILKDGIVDGRRTFANTLKYVAITTSANFGNMISMAVATLFLPFLPLAAKQILLNNFLSDFPSVAISTDNVDPGMLDKAQHWDIGRIQWFMIVFGLVSTAFDFLTFAVLLLVFQTPQPAFQTAWFVVSLLTELAVVLVLRTHLPSWRSNPSRLLFFSTLVVAVIAIALPYTGPLARIFGFVPLPLPLLLGMLAIALGYILATEAAKPWFYRTAPARAFDRK